jgi:CelD/BcsL family acetyltransferase involved in cellulose biosynthesis
MTTTAAKPAGRSSQPGAHRAPLVPAARVEVVRELGHWARAWDDLVANLPVPTPFLRSWWLSEVADGIPRFVLVTHERTLIGGIALEEDRAYGVSRLRMLGDGKLVPDHLDVLVTDAHREPVVQALRTWFRRGQPRVFQFDGLTAGSALLEVLPGRPRIEVVGDCPYRRLPTGDAADALADLPGAMRSTIRRARRKLEKAGVEHRVLPADHTTEGLERLRDLHERRWGEASGFLDVFNRFAAAATAGAQREEVLIHELHRDGEVLASQVDLLTAGRASYFQAGRNMATDLPSLGTVLMANAVEHAGRIGADEYDLLRGGQAYKDAWAHDARPVVRIEGWHGLRGRIGLSALILRRRAGALKGRARRALRHRLEAVRQPLAAVRRAVPRAASTIRELVDRTRDERVVITDAAGLESLRNDWSVLRHDVRSPSSELDHIIARARHLPEDASLRVMTIRRRGRLVGAAPMKLEVRRGREWLLPLESFEASGLSYADDAALGRLIDALVALGYPMQFPALPSACTTARVLRQRRAALIRSTTTAGGPSVALDDSWREPAAHLVPDRRRDMKRTWRKANEAGTVRVEVLIPGEDLEHHFEALVHLEARGWKGEAGTALAESGGERASLREYLTSPAVRHRVCVARMSIEDQLVAIDMGVTAGDRLWGLKGAYDETFRSVSPGLHLQEAMLRFAAETGHTHFEFMGETSRVKEMWGSPPVELRRLVVYPASLRGMSALRADAVAKARRAAMGLLRRTGSVSGRDAFARAGRLAFRHVGERFEAGPGHTVRVIGTTDELAALRTGWEALDGDIPGAPSGSLDWVAAFARHLRSDEQLRVLTLWAGEQLTAAAPFVLAGGRLTARLHLVILSTTGLRYADQRELERLVASIEGARYPVSFDLLPRDSRTVEVLASAFAYSWQRTDDRLAGPSIHLDPSWSEPLSKLSRNWRKSLRRGERRAADLGAVSFEVHETGDETELRHWFDEYVRVEALGWKSGSDLAFARDTRRQRLHWDYLSSPDVRSRVRIALLRIGASIAAIEISTLGANRWWAEKASFDPAFRDVSPGNLLHARVIAFAAASGMSTYEFLGRCEDYKAAWGDGFRVRSIRVYPPTPKGLLAIAADGLKALPRRAAHAASQARRRSAAIMPILRTSASRSRSVTS